MNSIISISSEDSIEVNVGKFEVLIQNTEFYDQTKNLFEVFKKSIQWPHNIKLENAND